MVVVYYSCCDLTMFLTHLPVKAAVSLDLICINICTQYSRWGSMDILFKSTNIFLCHLKNSFEYVLFFLNHFLSQSDIKYIKVSKESFHWMAEVLHWHCCYCVSGSYSSCLCKLLFFFASLFLVHHIFPTVSITKKFSASS